MINHAHIEQHTRIRTTPPTVINTVQPTALINSYFVIASLKFSNPTKFFDVGSLKGSRLINVFFLKEFINTTIIGDTNIIEITVNNNVAKIPFTFFITAAPPYFL